MVQDVWFQSHPNTILDNKTASTFTSVYFHKIKFESDGPTANAINITKAQHCTNVVLRLIP